MNYSWTIEITGDLYVVSLSESGPTGCRTWRYAISADDTLLPVLIKHVGERHTAFAKVLGDALVEYMSSPHMRRTSGDFFVKDEP